MGNILIKILIIFISSFLVAGSLYYHFKVIQLQQIILLLISILIITLRLLRNSIGKKAAASWLLIFIITALIQLLIASTGAVFSPFFVLIHLYVIGLSLFFNFWIAFSFLVMEIALLLLNIKFDQNLFNLVKNDFGSAALYFSSILVITPISKFISTQYHIKSDTLKSLFKELSTQQSIIEEIEDFVFTTDINLVVLSTNDSAKKVVKPAKKDTLLTDLVELRDEKGKRLNKESLLSSLAPLMQKGSPDIDKLNLIVKNCSLKIAGKTKAFKVIIRINPLFDQNNHLEKFIFLISQTNDQDNLDTLGSKLQTAHSKYTAALDLIRKDSFVSKLPTINLYLGILKKYEEDILIASQFRSSQTFSKIKVVDVFRIFVHIFEEYYSQSQQQNIEYKLNIPDNLQEEYRIKLANNKTPEYLTEPSSVSAATDPQLLQILIEKTIDITAAILLDIHKEKLNQKNSMIELEMIPSSDYIKLVIKTKIDPGLKEIIQGFLDINNDDFKAIDNLAVGSSLESYIIKNITSLLNISFITEYNQYSSALSFNISINRYFNNTH